MIMANCLHTLQEYRTKLRTTKPQRLFQMRGQKMDQTTFLSQTLWQFFEASAFTDLTLVCKDGQVSVHSPILSSLFIMIIMMIVMTIIMIIMILGSRCLCTHQYLPLFSSNLDSIWRLGLDVL